MFLLLRYVHAQPLTQPKLEILWQIDGWPRVRLLAAHVLSSMHQQVAGEALPQPIKMHKHSGRVSTVSLRTGVCLQLSSSSLSQAWKLDVCTPCALPLQAVLAVLSGLRWPAQRLLGYLLSQCWLHEPAGPCQHTLWCSLLTELTRLAPDRAASCTQSPPVNWLAKSCKPVDRCLHELLLSCPAGPDAHCLIKTARELCSQAAAL